MSTKLPYHGYHISPGYTLLTVYCFGITGQRQGVDRIRPNKGLTRVERYEVLAEKLHGYGLRIPEYIA